MVATFVVAIVLHFVATRQGYWAASQLMKLRSGSEASARQAQVAALEVHMGLALAEQRQDKAAAGHSMKCGSALTAASVAEGQQPAEVQEIRPVLVVSEQPKATEYEKLFGRNIQKTNVLTC